MLASKLLRIVLPVSLMFCLGIAPVAAQAKQLQLIGTENINSSNDPDTYNLSGNNKPNGRIYRLRESIPPYTPQFIPRRLGELSLVIADRINEPNRTGWLAFYRGAFRTMPAVSDFQAMFINDKGKVVWAVDLNTFLSSQQHLEIQDIHYVGGKLYFNEGCQTYSVEAKGKCSSLVKLDPMQQKVEWRSPYLVSNDIFLVWNKWVIAGYGFTDEPDYLYILDASNGKIANRYDLDSGHNYLEIKDNVLHVLTHYRLYRFRLP